VVLRIFPDDCDSFGHVNQAAYLRLFERARWESLRQGPGQGLMTADGGWPAVRRARIEYHAPAFPADAVAFDMWLSHTGRTSFTIQQDARRASDGTLLATLESVFVMIGPAGRPVPLPAAVREHLGTRPDLPGPPLVHVMVAGRRWALEQDGDGPALVLLHGFPMDRTLWRRVSRDLRGWRRVTPDLPGFGLSDPLSGPPEGMTGYADALARLLDALEIERAVLCGLSMGGYLAFEFLRRHRARVRALVLQCTRAGADGADARAGRASAIESVTRHGLEPLARSMLPRLVSPTTASDRPRVAEELRTMILDNQPGGVVTALEAMRDRTDSTDLLGSIEVPVLVVAGADDAIVPPDATERMVRGIPGARLVRLPGVGHTPPLEAPQETARIMSGFLGSLP